MTRFHGLKIIAMVAFGGIATAGHAEARSESLFACSQNESSPVLPTIEGKDAVFFRTQSDLRMQHPMNDGVVDQLARLSKALAQNGTVLIYAAIPSKSQGMPDELPDEAAEFGYDPAISAAAYEDIITRLNKAGIVAPDLLTALQAGGTPERPFLGADFHWTSSGARLAAKAIGTAIRTQPSYADLTPATFTSVPLKPVDAFSTMRRILQGYCVTALPRIETLAWQTTRVEAPADTLDIGLDTAPDASVDIFGSTAGGVQAVLVGTSFSDNEINNFAGFLSEFSGLDVSNQALTGGNQFGAITSYLTSTDFIADRPRFLIWENPVYNNLGRYGPAPMEELIAAAGGRCTTRLDSRVEDATTLVADLSGHDLSAKDAIFADFGAEGPRSAAFRLDGENGVSRSARISRADRLRATGRFYLGLSPYARGALDQVHVTFDRPLGPDAGIFLCLSDDGDPS